MIECTVYAAQLVYDAPIHIACKLANYDWSWLCPLPPAPTALITAVCTNPCENGGTCVAPDTCQCRATFTGVRCENSKSWREDWREGRRRGGGGETCIEEGWVIGMGGGVRAVQCTDRRIECGESG